jgi:hypothetical protein
MKKNQKNEILKILTAVIFILIGAGLRIIPHSPNFAPIGGLALFGGAYFSKKTALILPLAAMVISDVFIGYYEAGLMFFVYASFLIYAVLGFWLKKNKKWQTIGGSAILGAILFFLTTNFAVWAFTPWYAKTFSGVIQCYLMALPFFRNTLLGDLFFTAVFFGAYETAKLLIKKKTGLKEGLNQRPRLSANQKI